MFWKDFKIFHCFWLRFLKSLLLLLQKLCCLKSVKIRSFFWSVFSCIRTEYRKLRARKTSVCGHFSRSLEAENGNTKLHQDYTKSLISMIVSWVQLVYKQLTTWKVSKYGPEKTPYLDTFHAVARALKKSLLYLQLYQTLIMLFCGINRQGA